MTAQDLYDFLKGMQNNYKVNLNKVTINMHIGDDVIEAKDFSEDLFDSETNSKVESIAIFDHKL